MTMTNAEWCIKNGYKLRDIDASRKDDSNWEFEFKILASDHLYRKIGQLKTYNSMYPSEAVLEWLDMEHIEPILDDAEKRYLSAVVKPFRDDVLFIMKYKGCFSSRVYEEIAIWYRDKIDGERNYCMLPKFKKGTMYKNMEVSKHYTLEELGL